jgi:hypothetical protein
MKRKGEKFLKKGLDRHLKKQPADLPVGLDPSRWIVSITPRNDIATRELGSACHTPDGGNGFRARARAPRNDE